MLKSPWLEVTAVTTVGVAVISKSYDWFGSSDALWGIGASWVQAVGSVGAILAAAQIAKQQGERAQRESEQTHAAEANRRKAVLQGLADLVTRLQYTNNGTSRALDAQMGSWDSVEFARARIGPHQISVFALKKIPFHEVPYVYVGIDGLNFLNMCQHIVSHLETIGTVAQPFVVARAQTVSAVIAEISGHTRKAKEFSEKIALIASKYDGVADPGVHPRDL